MSKEELIQTIQSLIKKHKKNMRGATNKEIEAAVLKDLQCLETFPSDMLEEIKELIHDMVRNYCP